MSIGKIIKRFLGHPSGMTEFGSTAEDFSLGSIKNLEDVLKETKDGDDIIIAYNQYNNWVYQMSCTLFSPMSVVSSLYNIRLTDKEIASMREYAKKNGGYRALRGNSVKNGVETFCKRWNETYPDKAVLYFLTDLNSVQGKNIRSKNHLLATSYNGNSSFNKDKSDKLLQGVEFGAREYGHAIPMGKNDYLYDSNVPDFDSVYKIYPGNLQKLIDNGVFSSEAYAILPMNKIQPKVNSKLQEYLAKVKERNLARNKK